jgi:hypothetical protein
MITVAVQIQLSYSQTPEWRPSSTLGEAAKIRPLSYGGGGETVGGAEMARRPAAPVITFEGGSERGGGNRGREGGVNMSLY